MEMHRWRCLATRVSPQAQDIGRQLRQLRAAGCTEIFEEKASGTSRARPELARLLNRLRAGDTLVVVRIDRLELGPPDRFPGRRFEDQDPPLAITRDHGIPVPRK